MGVRVYIASITPNMEAKKQTQRVLMILDSIHVDYEAIDITEPGKEREREFMRTHGKTHDGKSIPLPPQIFNDNEYCGDYEDFDSANEINQLKVFLKLQHSVTEVPAEITTTTVAQNGYHVEGEMNGAGQGNEEGIEAVTVEDEDEKEESQEELSNQPNAETVEESEELDEGEEKDGGGGDIEREEGEVSADEAGEVEESQEEGEDEHPDPSAEDVEDEKEMEGNVGAEQGEEMEDVDEPEIDEEEEGD